MPKVGIVISNYNGWQDTLVCLDSLQKQTFTDFEVILIDDASPNDSVAQLQNKLPPNTVFLPQERNVGFAAANNIGMRRALDDGCDFALLLNNDTSVRPDFLEKLLAETPAGAVSCPKMLFMDPPDEIWFAGGELDPKTGKVKHLGGHKKDGPEFAEKKQVMDMVRRILSLQAVPKPDDAADAVAIALCHARSATSLIHQQERFDPCSTI